MVGIFVMKYIIMLAFLIASFALVIQQGIFSPQLGNDNAVIKIAQEMHDLALCCQTLSSEEMKEKRLQFLKNNKLATIEDLMKAIETKVNGQDVITFLDSFNCDVCKQYADSVKKDYEKGNRAIESNYGGTSIETVMYWRLL